MAGVFLGLCYYCKDAIYTRTNTYRPIYARNTELDADFFKVLRVFWAVMCVWSVLGAVYFSAGANKWHKIIRQIAGGSIFWILVWTALWLMVLAIGQCWVIGRTFSVRVYPTTENILPVRIIPIAEELRFVKFLLLFAWFLPLFTAVVGGAVYTAIKRNQKIVLWGGVLIGFCAIAFENLFMGGMFFTVYSGEIKNFAWAFPLFMLTCAAGVFACVCVVYMIVHLNYCWRTNIDRWLTAQRRATMYTILFVFLVFSFFICAFSFGNMMYREFTVVYDLACSYIENMYFVLGLCALAVLECVGAGLVYMTIKYFKHKKANAWRKGTITHEG